MKQAPPWKIALPFAAFCAITLFAWFISRSPVLLLGLAIAFVMGVIWTYGAWRVLRDEERLARSPEPSLPSKGDGVVLSRARLGGLNPLSPVGHLVASEEELLWMPYRQNLHSGRRIPLAGAAPSVSVARFDDIVRFQSKAGFMGGETLTLFLDRGRRRVRLLDPEGLSNLLATLPGDSDEE